VDPAVERLRAHLASIVGIRDPHTNPDALARVRAYVKAELARFGSVEEQPFWSWGGRGVNLSIRLGSGEAPPVLVGAHYDGVPESPAADDNASGVAGILELARRCAESPPSRPVRLAAFDLEEGGMFGGRAMARALKRRRAPLEVMLSLEMIGYCSRAPGSQHYPPLVGRGRPDTGDFIALLANGPARGPMERLARAMPLPVQTLVVPLRGWPVPATRLSDHSPFWDRGYPAVMVTDTAWMRNPNYHRPSDTIETLDFNFMAGVVEGVWRFLRE
jgi:Zn-dependent M28 family amino/carboxypeptidase